MLLPQPDLTMAYALPTPADRVRQAAAALAVVALVVARIPGVIGSVTGREIGDVADVEPTAFLPAGYAFSIWGLIYLAMLAYALYQAWPGRGAVPLLRRTGWPVAAASAAAAAWGFAYTAGAYALSLGLMAAALVALVAAFVGVARSEPLGRQETWRVRVPVSLFFGWITVASIANAADVLQRAGWDGFGLADATWAVVMIGVALLVTLFVLAWRGGDLAYAGVLVWGLVAIAVRQPAPMAPVALGAAAVIAAASVVLWRRRPAGDGAPFQAAR